MVCSVEYHTTFLTQDILNVCRSNICEISVIKERVDKSDLVRNFRKVSCTFSVEI